MKTMRSRITKTLLLAAAIVVTLPVVALAAPLRDDVKGKACADIRSGSAWFVSGTVSASMALVADSCSSVSYTATAYDDQGGAPIGSQTVNGNGGPTVTFSFPATSVDDVVFVAVQTTSGNRVFDNAPDAGSEIAISPAACGEPPDSTTLCAFDQYFH